jgi:nucleoside 2-deoxyribosyltransferase
MKVYLAGPMLGQPNLNHPMFDRVAAKLREAGHVVVSPAEKDREWGQDPEAAKLGKNTLDMHAVLRWDLQQVLDCDGIVLLPGWRQSQGTRLEVIVAASSGRKLLYWSTQAQAAFDLPWSQVADLTGIPSYCLHA